MPASIGFATLQVIPSLKGLDRAVTGQLGVPFARAGRNAGDQFSQGATSRVAGASKAIGVAAIAGLAGVGAAVGALGAFGVKAAASFQQTRIAFEGILGSAGKADAFLGQMRKFAAKTPFEFPELADSAKNLLAVGFAAKDVIPTMTTLGNVAATLGVGGPEIQGVVRALGQMKGKGKASAEELQQISEQLPGFSAIKAIADDMGISVADAFKEMQKGAIPADQAITSILNGMKKFPGAAGAMQRQSLTLNGVMSTFKDTMRDTLVGAFEPLLPTLSKSLTGVTPLLQSSLQKVVGAVAPVLPQLLNALTPILAVASDVLGEIVAGIGPALPQLGQAFAELVKSVVPLLPPLTKLAVALIDDIGVPAILAIAKAMGLLATAITPLISQTQILTPVIGALGAAFVGMKVLKGVQTGILGIAKASGTAVGTVQRLSGNFASAAKGIASFGKSALLGAVNIARQTAAFVAQKVAMIAAAVAQKALTAAQWLLNAAMTANPIGLIVAGVALLVAGVILAYKKFKPFRAIVDAVGRAFATVAKVITGALVGAFNWIKSHWPLLLAILTGPVGLAVIAWVKFGPKILDAVTSAFKAVVSFFAGLPAKILSALGAIGTLLVDVGKKILGGLLAGAQFALGAYLAFYVKLPIKILSLLTGAGKWLLGTGKSILGGLFKGVVTGAVAVYQFFVRLDEKILSLLVSAGTWLLGVGANIVRGLLNGITNGAVAVFSFFTGLQGKILTIFAKAGTWLVETGLRILLGLGDGIVGGTGAVLSWLGGLKDRIIGAIGDAGRWLFDVGRQIIQGLIDGIKHMLGKLGDVVGGIGSHLPGFIKGPLGIGSPSKVFMAIGGDVMDGLTIGLQKRMRAVGQQLGAVSDQFSRQRFSAGPVQVGSSFRPASVPISDTRVRDLAATRPFTSGGITISFAGATIYGDRHLKEVAKKAAIEGLREETRDNGSVKGVRVTS